MKSVMEIQETSDQTGRKRLLLDPRAALDDILTHPDCPVFLHSVLYSKLTWQKRSEFTVGRTLTTPGLAPQWTGALLAWGAAICLEDQNEILLEEALDLPGQTRSASEVSIPVDVPGRIWAEARTGSNSADFPIVWAMAVIDMDNGTVYQARIALSGVWRQSVGLAKSAATLAGMRLDAESIEKTAEAVMEEVNPISDYRGSAEYRRAMAGLMVRRALEACMEGVEV